MLRTCMFLIFAQISYSFQIPTLAAIRMLLVVFTELCSEKARVYCSSIPRQMRSIDRPWILRFLEESSFTSCDFWQMVGETFWGRQRAE